LRLSQAEQDKKNKISKLFLLYFLMTVKKMLFLHSQHAIDVTMDVLFFLQRAMFFYIKNS